VSSIPTAPQTLKSLCCEETSISMARFPEIPPKTVVILGAGWDGLPLAHKLLKYTLPKVKEGLKVYLVLPNSHFSWNIAAVRGVIPEQFQTTNYSSPSNPDSQNAPATILSF
jgi:hypothetical protein